MVRRTLVFTSVICVIVASVIGACGGCPVPWFKAIGLKSRIGLPSSKNILPRACTDIESTVVKILRTLEARHSDISIESSTPDRGVLIRARLPQGPPMEWFIWKLSLAISSASGTMSDCILDSKKNTYNMVIESTFPRRRVRLSLSRASHFYSTTARLAVIIERFSFDTSRWVNEILSFPHPITLALMAGGTNVSWSAQAGEQYRKEVIVLIPMEPLTRVPSNIAADVIYVHDSEEKIRKMLTSHFADVPNFSGCANYLGARALADSRVMAIVAGELKRRHAYFLEFRERRYSVAAAVVLREGVPYAAVDIRAAPKAGLTDIDAVLTQAIVTAQRYGFQIVSLPASAETIAVLKRKTNFIASNGVRFVFVSQLVRGSDRTQTIF